MPTTIPLEIETPVGSPELETPTAFAPTSFATARMRAELAAAEAAKHPEPLPETELPASLSASVARLREINALAPTDKSGQKAKASQLATMAAHVHRLSQGPTSPPINYTEFFKRHVPASALAFVMSKYPKSRKP